MRSREQKLYIYEFLQLKESFLVTDAQTWGRSLIYVSTFILELLLERGEKV